MHVAEKQRWISAQKLLDDVMDELSPAVIETVRGKASRSGCSDEFEALLAATQRTSALDLGLDRSLKDLSLATHQQGMLRGRRLGRWTLGEEVGRGGMSVVYQAERTSDGFRQRAALKILAVSFASEAMVEAFFRERQILSELSHPGIARLIDGGVTEEGSPFIVMEFVNGQRIDQWCRAHDLNTRRIVELVATLCEAVAYAQRHLVIHRDINQTNVLVNKEGRPILIDFGIAGLLGGGEGKTVHAFTPSFAAPEQVEGGRSTTATDVFAIGRLLETLLPDDERDPDLALLIDVATRDDPAERYPNARALRDDLVAWLEQRPMTARAPSLGYRINRFAARNRWLVLASTLMLASIIGALIVTAWQARIASQERDLARLESERASRVTAFLMDLFRASDPDEAQGQSLSARALLDQGAHQLAQDRSLDPALRTDMLLLLGGLYLEIGSPDRGEPLLREALQRAEARDEYLQIIDALALLAQVSMELGDHAGALDTALTAETRLHEAGLVPGSRHAALMQTLIFTLTELGNVQGAVERAREALTTASEMPGLEVSARFHYLYALANALLIAEQAELAEPLLQEALSLDFEQLEDPSIQYNVHSNLAGIADRVGNLDQSLQHRRAALELAEAVYPADHPLRARALSNLSTVLNALGQHAESIEALTRALEIYEVIYQGDANPRLAAVQNNLARAYQTAGRYEEAAVHQMAAREMARELFGIQDPRYAIASANLGSINIERGRLDEADSLLLDNIRIREELLGPEHRAVGQAFVLLAKLRLAQGRPEEALALCDDALALFDRIGFENLQFIVTAMSRRASALADLGNVPEARRQFELAFERAALSEASLGTTWVELLSTYASFLARINDAGAAAALRQSLEAHREILGPNHPDTRELAARFES